MKKLRMRKALAAVVLLVYMAAWGQDALKYRELSTEDGLPSNYVINFVQDPHGYVWIATADGLCRYDGYSFDVLRHEEEGNNALLLSNRIRELYQNANGLLFIRLQGERYSCYDTNTMQFVSFFPGGCSSKNYCDCVFTPEGDTWLWYSGTGCIEVTYHNGKVESREYNAENGLLSSNGVQFIECDSRQRVWVGTDEGLYVKDNGQFRAVCHGGQFRRMAEVSGKTYFVVNDNDLYCAGDQGDINKVDVAFPAWQSGNRIRCMAPIGDRLIIVTQGTTYQYQATTGLLTANDVQMPEGTVYRDNVGNYYVADKKINIYYFDQARDEIYTFHVLDPALLNKRGLRPYDVLTGVDGRIYITTTGNGLFVYDPASRLSRHYSGGDGRVSPVKTDYLYRMMSDRSGNIWISEENLGVSVITTMPKGVKWYFAEDGQAPNYANYFRAVRQTSDGRIWVGNFMGQTYLWSAANGLQPTNIGVDDDLLAVCIDADGHLWKGTRHNGVIVDGRSCKSQPDDSTSLANGKVFDIFCDSRRRVWVAVNPGALCLAQPQPDGTYRFRRFLDGDALMRSLTTVIETRSGHLFVGCANGFVAFDPEELIRNPKAYYHYHAENSALGFFEVRDLYEDRDGAVWLATAGGGIYRIANAHDIAHLQMEALTTGQGLVDNIANSIIGDQQGNLWIGTHNGLSRLDPKTMQMTSYSLSAGKLGDIYCENSSCLLPDGTLVFGTNSGLVAFHPETAVLSSTTSDYMAITNLLVNGEMYHGYEGSGNISLSHRKNSLTFRFSDMKFAYPHNTEYVYMLKGVDTRWSHPTHSNEAVYRDLDPGTYVFMVRKVGDPEDRTATMEVTIRQPWWNTWWAWLIYITVIGGIIWYIGRLLLITYSMRNRIRMDKKINEFKHKFFMDVSHEFRTPLTLIQGAMERMRKSGELPASLKQPVSNMSRSTERMIRLVNQLLEFHKLQHGKLNLKLQETDVIKFVRDITMSFSDMAQNKQMNLQFVPFAQHYNMYVDRGFLDKMVYNLLSNAFKYTPKRGEVIVRVKNEGEQLVVRVEDNGVGVPKEKQPLLFTRFMQTTAGSDSFGIGLHFTEHLAEAHHGRIRYEENPAGGSFFIVSLPTSKEVYRPEDFLPATEVPSVKDEEMEVSLKNYKELLGEPLNDRLVLVVEDDDDVREYIRTELSVYFNVVTAQNGVEALELLKGERQVELVVSDIKMPQMDGIELLKKVRADDDIFDVPLILLTALNTIEKQLQGARFGADDYIPKPFSPALLVGRCISLIRQRDRLRAAYAMPQETSADVRETAAGSNGADSVTTPLLTSERDRKFLEIIERKIMANLSNPDFVVDDLARSTGYGRSQFYSKMMEVTGNTPKEFIRQRRMARAAELLRMGEMITVAEVAYQVGFSDPLYFSRCFKQHFGITPSKYQRG